MKFPAALFITVSMRPNSASAYIGGGFYRGEVANIARGIAGCADRFANFFAGLLQRIFAAPDDELLRRARRSAATWNGRGQFRPPLEKNCAAF